ncbi:uncharacterized protein ACB057_015591 [Neosynchiropus ocellatus]
MTAGSSLLLSSVILLVSGVLREGSLEDSIRTYNHRDRVTGEVLVCAMCPPGQHLVSHCTATTPTRCAPCQKNHFTEISNYRPECLYCNNYCTRNMEVQEECSPVKNRVCRCKDGFYMMMDFCLTHSKCGPGHGVLKRGTPHSNTECEECAEGFFSSSTSATEACVKHSVCASHETALLAGSSHTDRLCGTCQDLAEGGALFRKFLSQFLSTHLIQERTMRRFVSRHVRELAHHGGAPQTAQVPPMARVGNWIAHAPSEHLWKLPQMLRAARLKSLERKLTNKLKRIEGRSPNCTFISLTIEQNRRARKACHQKEPEGRPTITQQKSEH